jgi:hypothetical protein
MDTDLAERIEKLRNEIIAAAADVSAALEIGEEHTQLGVGAAVDEVVKRYQALASGVDKDRVEIALGRHVTDLRRAAAQLAQRASGSRTELAVDTGMVPFLLQRKPGKSIVPERAAPTGKLSVGSEVDAWCGKCKEIRTHNVVAMVGGEPKQVVCQTCSSRHNFRTDPPARARTASGSVPVAVGTAAARAVDKEQASRQEQKRVLQKELADAPEPRTFDPKARYKSGEIIVHPEYGRGKVENVLRTSLLVRFLEGLRPLDLD